MRIGTRKSPLAQAQTDRVLAALAGHRTEKIIVASTGDVDRVSPMHKMERPGAFTHALTDAILDGRIDAAVHSLKDLPLQAPREAPVVAVMRRDDPADVLLVREDHEDATRPLGLKPGSRVGTSAPRRQSQILDADPDLIPVDVRGNVATRLRLLDRGVVDGLLMAAAGLERLNLKLPHGIRRHRLDPTRFPGCPGQGAIAVQARRGSEAARILSALDHDATRQAVEVERQLLGELGGGCGLPLGVFAEPGLPLRVHATYGHSGKDGRVRLVRWSGSGSSMREVVAAAAKALRAPPSPPALALETPWRTVFLTLSPERLEPYREALQAAGWNVEPWSAVQTRPTGKPLPPEAKKTRWIAVTSPRGATFALQATTSLPGPLRIAAVGPATVAELRRLGLSVHVVAPDGTGSSLADAIAVFPAEPCPVLVPQATKPAGGLAEGLRAHRFQVIPWEVYSTQADPQGAPSPPHAQALVFTSPSAVHVLRASLSSPPPGVHLIAFGPTTAQAMRDAGLPVHAVCERRTPSGVREALS